MLVSDILTHFKRCLSSILWNYSSFQIYLPFTNGWIVWTCEEKKLITRMQEKKLLQWHLPSNKCVKKKKKTFSNEEVCDLLNSGIVSVLHCILLMNYIIVVLVGWTDAEMSLSFYFCKSNMILSLSCTPTVDLDIFSGRLGVQSSSSTVMMLIIMRI